MKERRQHPRFTCAGKADIRFRWNEEPSPARIEDLSVTGCKLVLLKKADIRLRSIFELTFTVNRLPFRLRARAIGMRGQGCIGVEFVGLSLTTTRYLHDLIDELAAQRWRATA